MATRQDKFERWRRRALPPTATLAQAVLDDVVPLFTDKGFAWHADYATGRKRAVAANTIALQRRDGEAWPTVEISFDHDSRPSLQVIFAWLPAQCYVASGAGTWDRIPREQATVIDGPAVFSLCKGRGGSNDHIYGLFGLSQSLIGLVLDRHKRLQGEVAQLQDDCRWLLGVLAAPMPKRWLDEGLRMAQVGEHARLLGKERLALYPDIA
ncbi:MAG: hypothetical protein ABL907_04935 [Hyphomicrobium sp.]